MASPIAARRAPAPTLTRGAVLHIVSLPSSARATIACVQAMCAFCGRSLDTAAPGSLWIAVGSERVEGSQGLSVHFECMAERLHPEIPFGAWSFEPDDPSEDIPDVWGRLSRQG